MNNEIVLLRRIEELKKLIQRQPEVGGVWQDWTPTITWNGTAPTTLDAKTSMRYCVIGKLCFINLYIFYTNAGSSNTLVQVTVPIPLKPGLEAVFMNCSVSNGISLNNTQGFVRTQGDFYIVCSSVSANRLKISGAYEIA